MPNKQAKDKKTEQLLKDTAKQIYFAEGRLHATTQEIADAAGMNRAALHYYFRSRDQLIQIVFHEAMETLNTRMAASLSSTLPFRQKIESLIDTFLQDMLRYPYLETFLITEINNSGQNLLDRFELRSTAFFLTEVEQEMKKGTIPTMHPTHFLMNLFSLLSYPLIMAPLYRRLFQLDATDFDRLMMERKQIILRMLFK